jgi:purine nucleoside phosphorylase
MWGKHLWQLAIGIFERAEEVATSIRELIAIMPRVAIVLGSGLGSFAERIEQPVSIPYPEIPYFPRPTVEGHSGRLVVGTVAGTPEEVTNHQEVMETGARVQAQLTSLLVTLLPALDGRI